MNRFSINIIIFAIAIFCVLPLNQSSAALTLNSSKSKGLQGSPKVNQNLKNITNQISEMTVTRSDVQSEKLSSLSNPLVKVDDKGNVEVFLYCNEVSNENLAELQSLGLIIEDMNDEHKIVHGWMPYENLEEAAEIGFDGTGIKIGVISDGVDSLAVSQATGDLPGFVDVGSNANGGDEGTAMLEIIHDIAPGADLAFHTAFPTSVQFLNAIEFFISIGADIIVDDVGFLTQPYFL